MKEKRQRYQAYGVVFGSDFDLGSNNLEPSDEYDVLIEEGSIPELNFKPLKEGVCFQAGKEDFLLDIPEVGRYWIHKGELIIVDPLPQATEEAIVLFLMGSAFGALLIQRKSLVLHASAIEKDGRAIIFSGISGAGKSTISTLLQERGYPFITDDMASICQQTNEVFPGFNRMKIWEDILVYLKTDFNKARRIRPNIMKYHVPVSHVTNQNKIPIEVMYVVRTHNKNSFSCKTLHGIEKFNALKNNTYRLPYIAGSAAQQVHFEQCNRLAEAITVRQLMRPRNNKDMDALADFVLDDLDSIKLEKRLQKKP